MRIIGIWLLVCVITINSVNVSGQVRGEVYMPSFFVDIDAGAGILNQQAKFVPISLNYPKVVNPYQGSMSFKAGLSSLADIQFGYYINRKRTWGIGIGLMVNKQSSTLGLDSFHVEFKSTDFKDSVFRQLISTNHPISESITMQSIKIPILLRYKKDFSNKFFVTVDGGIVYDIQTQNTWNTNASFKYEAIYEFVNGINTYDNNPIPGSNDWLITVNNFLRPNVNGNVSEYFETLNESRYSVGLNETPKNSSGTFKLATGTIGYTLDAALNFRITSKIYFKLGAFYLSKNFNNTSANNSLTLTDKIIRNNANQDIGVDYNSLVNFTKSIQSNSYGITAGIKIYLSKHSLLDYQ